MIFSSSEFFVFLALVLALVGLAREQDAAWGSWFSDSRDRAS